MKFSHKREQGAGSTVGKSNLIRTQRGLPGRSDLRLRTEEEMGISPKKRMRQLVGRGKGICRSTDGPGKGV